MSYRKITLLFGSSIIEVIRHQENGGVILNISKQNREKDEVHLSIPYDIAESLAIALKGE